MAGSWVCLYFAHEFSSSYALSLSFSSSEIIQCILCLCGLNSASDQKSPVQQKCSDLDQWYVWPWSHNLVEDKDKNSTSWCLFSDVTPSILLCRMEAELCRRPCVTTPAWLSVIFVWRRWTRTSFPPSLRWFGPIRVRNRGRIRKSQERDEMRDEAQEFTGRTLDCLEGVRIFLCQYAVNKRLIYDTRWWAFQFNEELHSIDTDLVFSPCVTTRHCCGVGTQTDLRGLMSPTNPMTLSCLSNLSFIYNTMPLFQQSK